MRRSPRTRSRAVRRALAGVIVLFGVGTIALIGLWRQIDRAAQVDDANGQSADAVVVLGCAVQAGGEPSPALQARIDQGIRVWRDTRSRCLLATGGVGHHPPAEAVVMGRIASEQHVPAAAVIEDVTAHRTEDSATVCASLAEQNGWKRVILVSDPWHLLRARRMFQDAAPGLDVRQSPAFDSPAWTITSLRNAYTFRECLAYPTYVLFHRRR